MSRFDAASEYLEFVEEEMSDSVHVKSPMMCLGMAVAELLYSIAESLDHIVKYGVKRDAL